MTTRKQLKERIREELEEPIVEVAGKKDPLANDWATLSFQIRGVGRVKLGRVRRDIAEHAALNVFREEVHPIAIS